MFLQRGQLRDAQYPAELQSEDDIPRMAIIRIAHPGNETERSAAVAAMGSNFTDVLPDGSVIPLTLYPGRYTLVLLDENNIQVPASGV